MRRHLLAQLIGSLITITTAAVFAAPAFSQDFVGEPFPLTNASHRAGGGPFRLVETGAEPWVFWSDTSINDHQYQPQLRMSRVDPNGSRRAITALSDFSGGFAAAPAGAHFLVAAAEYDKLTVRRIRAHDGRELESQLIATPEVRRAEIAFNGTRGLIVWLAWSRELLSFAVYGMLLDANGAALSDSPLIITPDATTDTAPAIVTSGDVFGVVATSNHQVTVAIIDSLGNVVGRHAIDGRFPAGSVIGTDGERFFVAWSESYLAQNPAGAFIGYQSHLYAQLFERNGSPGPRLFLAGSSLGGKQATSIAWDRDSWLIVIRSTFPGAPLSWTILSSYEIARVDRQLTALQYTEHIAGDDPQLARVHDDVYVAYRTTTPPALWISAIPLRSSVPVLVARVPQNQKRLAEVQAADETFVVWSEDSATFAGLRRADGRWTEQQIDDRRWTSAVAAHGSAGFAVVGGDRDSYRFFARAVAFDHEGSPTTPAVPVSELVDSLASLGKHWFAARRGRVYLLFSPQGPVWKAPRMSSDGAHTQTVLATDGNGFLVIWNEGIEKLCTCWFPYGPWVTRLTPDLRSAMPTPYALGDGEQNLTARWTGTEYFVEFGEKGAAYIDATGVRMAIRGPSPRRRIFESYELSAPIYGARRLIMRVSAPSPLPRKPDPPNATAYSSNGTYVLSWSASSEPISGYRIEVQEHGDLWTELDRVYAKDEKTATFTPRDPGAPIMFRVRAWNDAGVGGYSNVVTFNVSRRRAIK